MGKQVATSTEEEVLELERLVRFKGFYPLRCEQDEYEVLARDDERREAAFQREMVQTVSRWLEMGEAKLPAGCFCVSIPGNDDEWAIDAPLNESQRVLNCDRRVCGDDRIQVMGFGASNATPWRSPRECTEAQIKEALDTAAKDLDEDRPVIANIHVPPYGSNLDDAPAVDEDLRLVIKGGAPVFGPVGSHAVRGFLTDYQPCLGLHGHVHESRGTWKTGNCFALNPGSDYGSGALQAAVVTVDLKKKKVSGHQFIMAG